MTVNPWTMGSESEDKVRIPSFCKARFMVTKVVPPKTGTVRDGLVAHLALIDYETEEGDSIQVTKVLEGPSGFEIEFPLGKHLVLATKFRGPKNIYNFKNPTTDKWTKIDASKFTLEFALSFLSSSVEGWTELSDLERASHVDDYFEEMYMFGLANDFAFDTTGENYETPKPGLITTFYRRYTPPKDDERYGRVTPTKWASRKIENEKGLPDIDGTFEMKDEAIAEAVISALVATAKPKDFDPTSDDAPF